MYQVEEMRPGARTAVVTCMGVKLAGPRVCADGPHES
jgi:hypothetical protein